MNLVYRHKSGGELWQGGAEDVKALASRHDPRIKTIALFAIEFQPDIRSGRYEVLKHGFNDNSWMQEQEAREVVSLADRVSDGLAKRIRAGHGVLSSCYAGWNRSGLVSGLTLMKVADVSPDEAVGLIREARGPDALCNNLFVRMIHWMKHKKGAISTWTEWRSRGTNLIDAGPMVTMTTEELAAVLRRLASGRGVIPLPEAEI